MTRNFGESYFNGGIRLSSSFFFRLPCTFFRSPLKIGAAVSEALNISDAAAMLWAARTNSKNVSNYKSPGPNEPERPIMPPK